MLLLHADAAFFLRLLLTFTVVDNVGCCCGQCPLLPLLVVFLLSFIIFVAAATAAVAAAAAAVSFFFLYFLMLCSFYNHCIYVGNARYCCVWCCFCCLYNIRCCCCCCGNFFSYIFLSYAHFIIIVKHVYLNVAHMYYIYTWVKNKKKKTFVLRTCMFFIGKSVDRLGTYHLYVLNINFNYWWPNSNYTRHEENL